MGASWLPSWLSGSPGRRLVVGFKPRADRVGKVRLVNNTVIDYATKTPDEVQLKNSRYGMPTSLRAQAPCGTYLGAGREGFKPAHLATSTACSQCATSTADSYRFRASGSLQIAASSSSSS